jgi:hypothetical protein
MARRKRPVASVNDQPVLAAYVRPYREVIAQNPHRCGGDERSPVFLPLAATYEQAALLRVPVLYEQAQNLGGPQTCVGHNEDKRTIPCAHQRRRATPSTAPNSSTVGTAGNVADVLMLRPASGFRARTLVAWSHRKKVLNDLYAWWIVEALTLRSRSRQRTW